MSIARQVWREIIVSAGVTGGEELR